MSPTQPIPSWVHRTYTDPTWRIPWDYPVDSFHWMIGVLTTRHHCPTPANVPVPPDTPVSSAPVKQDHRAARRARRRRS